jgi:hypothetical protein
MAICCTLFMSVALMLSSLQQIEFPPEACAAAEARCAHSCCIQLMSVVLMLIKMQHT